MIIVKINFSIPSFKLEEFNQALSLIDGLVTKELKKLFVNKGELQLYEFSFVKEFEGKDELISFVTSSMFKKFWVTLEALTLNNDAKVYCGLVSEDLRKFIEL